MSLGRQVARSPCNPSSFLRLVTERPNIHRQKAPASQSAIIRSHLRYETNLAMSSRIYKKFINPINTSQKIILDFFDKIRYIEENLTERTMEKWVDVPGWPGFQVTRNGDIRKNGKIIQPYQRPDGYQYVRIDQSKILYIHRAVLLAFIGQPKEEQETRHLNSIPSDNRLKNLMWGTMSEQREDNRRNGIKMGRPKLKSPGESLLTTGEAAGMIGVCPLTIRNWAKAGIIPHIKIGRQIRFNRKKIEEWLKRQSQEATT